MREAADAAAAAADEAAAAARTLAHGPACTSALTVYRVGVELLQRCGEVKVIVAVAVAMPPAGTLIGVGVASRRVPFSSVRAKTTHAVASAAVGAAVLASVADACTMAALATAPDHVRLE